VTIALSGWAEITAALTAFFASHLVPARPPVRRFFVECLGKRIYTALYSATSLAILFWLIVAAGRAPQVRLWDFEPWQLWVPNIVMPLACLLIAFGVAAPSPFSVAGRDGSSFDPELPGIAGVTRHPNLWAITLWAAAHTVPNGDLAHVMLFGLFAVFGITGMFILDARKRREWGQDLWARWAARTSIIPFAAVAVGDFKFDGLRRQHIVRTLAALALYLTLLMSHQAIIGVSPLPPL
jgi:uncharacterized membrane protein